jgi:transposase
MTDPKQQILQLIETLPDTVTVDEIMEELSFKLQVNIGLRELDEGKGISHEEVEKRFSA